MTPIEFRAKKTHEIQELLEKISSLDGTSFSSENKDRLFRTYRRHLERLTVIVSSPSLRTTLLRLKAKHETRVAPVDSRRESRA
jgi:hypothetical protein